MFLNSSCKQSNPPKFPSSDFIIIFNPFFSLMHTNRLINPPRPLTVLFSLLLLLFSAPAAMAQPQTPVAAWLDAFRPFAEFQTVELFQPLSARADIAQVVENARVFQMDPTQLSVLYQTAPAALRFSIPNPGTAPLVLELAQVEILADDFKLSSDAAENLPFERGIHYRGVVQGNPAAIACLSIHSDGLTGMVADETGTYELGQMEDGSGHYLFYKTQHLKMPAPHQCHADEESLAGDEGGESPAEDRGVGCKTVQVYFECDNKLYTDKGSSTANVNTYVTGLFNQVATLYANENVGMVISQIFVWTTLDPYRGYSSTSSVLNAFRQTRGTSFNGNLAHLLSTRSLGGGIAYVDVICFKQYAYGVSAISTSYQNVPTYSWSVEVVTHELGHNLGSWHTHSCNWPGGALDNCVSPEGSCAPGPTPVNGGTIMSYCHLTSHGINFTKGFGPTPGARIRDKVLNAACVPQSGTVPTGLSSNNITATSATLQWAPVQGATSYTVQYKLTTSGNWTTAGTSTAATYNLSGLTASSNYQWQVKTDCSNFSTTASFNTLNGGGGGNTCNTPGGLGTAGIGSTSATLFWSSVPGAVNYTVQYKNANASNWTTAGTTAAVTLTLTNLTALTQYQWQVKANCSSWSSTATFSTPNSGGGGGGTCNPPVNLNNNTIGGTYAVISWAAVSGATNYTLQIKLANGLNWFTLGAVSVTSVVVSGLQPSTTYHWRVKANCSDYSVTKILTTNSNLEGDGTDGLSQPTLAEGNNWGKLALFPNPAKEQLNLNFVGEIFQNARLMVCDAAGRVVAEQPFQPMLEVADWQPGIYFVSLYCEGKRIATERFVKAQ
jgi:hypothetical protein